MAEADGAPARGRKAQRPPKRQAVGTDGRTLHVRYSRALAAEICRRVGQGEAWSQFCSTDGMPSYQTLYSWRRRYPEFAQCMAAAKQEAAERKATRALEVAEGAPEGVPGDRLRVTTLMQLAALEAPHVWGGKAPPTEPPATGEAVRIVFSVRKFEKVIGPDGKAYVREKGEPGEPS